ncbi:MAG: alpha/beta fold hydrolase [Clostridia bacterium]|nr:alpha/beta fold hydrolase [Clostridia bacterium]
MSYTLKVIKAPSSDGKHTLVGRAYIPEGEARGFFQVVHGMAEHIARYDGFMRKMAEEGWVCFGHDHLGHGMTAESDDELGFIASKGGDALLVDDVKAYYDAVAAELSKTPEQPYVLMGHSMGSFVVRLAAAKYGEPDKLIIMGTGGKNPLAAAGLALIAIIKKFYGEKHISKLVDSMAFGAYNKRFGGGSEDDPAPWLTTDESIRRTYYEDKFCGFKFTVSAMGDLIRMIKNCNKSAWYGSLRADMKILLVSGGEDPVGNYSKGVLEVKKKLEKLGADVKCVIYENARHEILNDFSRENVIKDIIEFVK